MKNLILVTSVAVSLAACTHKPKSEMITEATPAPVVVPTKAQAVLKASADTKIKGIIHFTEEDGKMKIETLVDGLKAGPHGFHIHETGDCSKADFTSAGGHFNPTHGEHGSMSSAKKHIGDLGNLIANNKKKANTTLVVEGMTMKPGANSIIGKAVIIHKDQDDLKSQPAGNAGARIACGVIEAL